MKKYVGTKVIGAKLSNLVEYKKEKYGENAILTENDINVIGYIVYYPGIGENKDIYTSWSPKEVFELCYREILQEEINLINKEV